jgi:hypothetical protein
MKRSYILSLTLFLCSFAAFPQATITLSDPHPVFGGSIYYFAQKDEILSVKTEEREITLLKTSVKTLKTLKTNSYTDFPKDFIRESVRKIKGRYYLLYSTVKNKTERELFAREIDFATAAFTGPAKKILAIDEELAGYGFYIYSSYDTSKLLVRYRLVPEKKRDAVSYDILGFHVFDENFQEKWAKKVTMPYTEKKMNFLDYEVDGAGNVYIAASVFNDNTTDLKNDKDEANYKIEILKIAAGTGTIAFTKVNLADTFIKYIWLYQTPQGKLIGAGLYNKGSSDGGVDGLVIMKFRGEGEQPELKTYEIPIEIINQYVSSKTKRKNDKKEDKGASELSDLRLREVRLQPDGGILMVGEQAFSVTHDRYMNGRSSSYTVSHYNDLLATRIDANGSLVWMRKLPKSQLGGSVDYGLGYEYAESNGAHFFLFLDNEKNKDLAITDVPEDHVDTMGGFLTAYKLDDKTGTVKKLSLLNVRDVQGTELIKFNPKRMISPVPGTWIFESDMKGKKDVMMKVVMDK